MRSKSRQTTLAGVLALGLALSANTPAQSDPKSSLLITAAPDTIIWVDSLRYGVVPASGELTIHNLPAGARTVRARLQGKRELTRKINLASDAQQTVQLNFSAPAARAELAFQSAEESSTGSR